MIPRRATLHIKLVFPGGTGNEGGVGGGGHHGGIIQPCGVGVHRGEGGQPLRLGVHLLHKGGHRARRQVGQGTGSIVVPPAQGGIQKIPNGDLLAIA